MISLAGRDILNAWGKFIFTGIGLGLLIGVTLTMAGVYRGMVDDGKALLDNSGADLWVDSQTPLGLTPNHPATMTMATAAFLPFLVLQRAVGHRIARWRRTRGRVVRRGKPGSSPASHGQPRP